MKSVNPPGNIHTGRTRDAALRRLSRANRWLIAGSALLTGVLTDVAANAFPGHKTTASTRGRASRSKHGTHHALKAPAAPPRTTTTQSAPPPETQTTQTQTAPAEPQQPAPVEEAHTPAPEAPQPAPAESQPESHPETHEQAPAPAAEAPVVSGGS